jgi:pimeloyl-ACP methyl ester carboxylesterase
MLKPIFKAIFNCQNKPKAVFIALWVTLICLWNQASHAETPSFKSFSVTVYAPEPSHSGQSIETRSIETRSIETQSIETQPQHAPVLLIPGLMSDGRIWQSTVSALRAHHEVHVVHIAGFAGKPAIHGPLLAQVQTELLTYIKQQRLQQPIVIGHSLGGFLAFALASQEPTLIGPIVAVDGLPYLAPVFTRDANTQVGQMQTQAQQLQQYYQQATAEQFQAMIQQGLFIQATAKADTDTVLAMAMASDRTTVGQAMYELLTTDLRSEVQKIQQPVLLLGAGGALPSAAMRPAVEALYQQQIATVPKARLVFNWQSRHFMMLDSPEWMLNEIKKFLQEASE